VSAVVRAVTFGNGKPSAVSAAGRIPSIGGVCPEGTIIFVNINENFRDIVDRENRLAYIAIREEAAPLATVRPSLGQIGG
jgi:hypothetical protein